MWEGVGWDGCNSEEIGGVLSRSSSNFVRAEEFLAIKMNQVIGFINEPYLCFPTYLNEPFSKLLAVLQNAYEYPTGLTAGG